HRHRHDPRTRLRQTPGGRHQEAPRPRQARTHRLLRAPRRRPPARHPRTRLRLDQPLRPQVLGRLSPRPPLPGPDPGAAWWGEKGKQLFGWGLHLAVSIPAHDGPQEPLRIVAAITTESTAPPAFALAH